MLYMVELRDEVDVGVSKHEGCFETCGVRT